MAHYGQVLKEPPGAEPLSLDQAKAELLVDHGDDDTLLGQKIAEARTIAEAVINRKLITQTWTLVYDCFPRVIVVPLGPVQSIDAVRYRNATGSLTTLTSDQWQAATRFEPVRIMPPENGTWPQTQRVAEAVEVDVTVGYGDAGSDVPPAIIAAIRLILNSLYDQRAAPEMSWRFLLTPHILHV